LQRTICANSYRVHCAAFPTPFSRPFSHHSALQSSASSLTLLVDAYCDACLFTLTLVPHFTQVTGIELSTDLICFTMHNVALNGLMHEVYFCAGDAAQTNSTITNFPPDHTALILAYHVQWAPKALQCFAVSDCMQCGALWNGNHTLHYREKV
jgi:hypothetical protein